MNEQTKTASYAQKKEFGILLSTEPFAALTVDEAERLIASSVKKTFSSGEVVEYPGSNVTLILSGRVSVTKKVGSKTLVMRTMGSGSISGVASVFTDEEGDVSLLTATKKTEAMFIPGASLTEAIHHSGVFAERYIRFLTSRIRFLNARIKAYTGGSAEARLALYLLGICEEGETEVDLGCPVTALTDTLDVGRASLYRAIDGLTEKGLIVRKGRRIFLLDRDALAAL